MSAGDSEVRAPSRVAERGAAAGAGFLVALNAYYLQEEAARAIRSGSSRAPTVEEVLLKACSLGVRAVRTHGFNDDVRTGGDSAIQIARLVYDEISLRGLDLVLTRAAELGLRLVLPLGNYWDDYGGTRQYVAWAHLSEPQQGDPRFFTDRSVIDHYKEHVRRLLSRINSFDGIRYGDHPSILVFELLNEPRGVGLDPAGTQMRTWVDELGSLVKSLAPGKLVGTGEEGFDLPDSRHYDRTFWPPQAASSFFTPGSSFALNVASPYVDYASIPLYPDSWGIQPANIAPAGIRWIQDHASIARVFGKRLLVGEFGLRNDGPLGLPGRRSTYRTWMSCAASVGALGAAAWLFAYDARPSSWDAYTFRFVDGTEPDAPVNQYADILLEASLAARS